jgi:hypothetical protein
LEDSISEVRAEAAFFDNIYFSIEKLFQIKFKADKIKQVAPLFEHDEYVDIAIG